ncbi:MULTISPECIES: tRNA lysidine(34) synthetase TilS [Microbulbifer]|uniref:tRNA lysidine(34) synthetase TilS n=1 Tax=Microbulbifer TaxID=48073 RepID=UPI001E4FFAAD|nr:MULTISPECIES: tRNA lysidine(34) synthetase TilS [Microbulbifer]UHQ56163.1 tRNA lysidine(34) synthetase TilS [Microbulbifer sp. YPW16]
MQDQLDVLRRNLASVLAEHPCTGRRWVALSGGLDSCVLLHLLNALGEPCHAIHINHQLSPNAGEWQAHCRGLAESLGIPLTTRSVTVDDNGRGPEEAARRARYAVFAGLLREGDQLLTAHHGDDQAETFLLRLLRGAGVQGLAAMAATRPLGAGVLVRPLLGSGRAELERYARAAGLAWVDDESNADTRFDRNFLRREVMPRLRSRWPVRDRIGRAVANLGEAAELLRELAREDLQACGLRRERSGESVDLDHLGTLSQARCKNLLRYWVHGRAGDMPAAVQLAELLRQLGAAREDRLPAVELGPLCARRYRGRLYLLPPLAPIDPGLELAWSGEAELQVPGAGTVVPRRGWPPGDYRVRFRRGGERARPVGRGHSQTLKKLLQEYGLEPWLRERVPLIFEGEQMLAVGDLFLCQGDREGSLPGTPGWQPETFSD